MRIKNDPLGPDPVDTVLPGECPVPVTALRDQESLRAPCAMAPRHNICSAEPMLPEAGTRCSMEVFHVPSWC